MKFIWAKAALTLEGWQLDVRIWVAGTSVITAVDAKSIASRFRKGTSTPKEKLWST